MKGFQGDSVVKNLPAKAGDAGLIMGQEDPLRRKWQPTPGFLPGKFHGQRNLVGYSPWDGKKSDTFVETKQRLLFSTFNPGWTTTFPERVDRISPPF